MVEAIRSIPKPQRWDLPFWNEKSDSDSFRDIPPMTEDRLEKVMTFSPFREMDPNKFTASCPLEGVLLNDARIRICRPGELIVRQGDYGNSAFFILKGSVRVILETLAQPQEKGSTGRKTFFGAVGQFLRRPKLPEVRNYEKRRGLDSSGGGDQTTSPAVFLQDVSAIYKNSRSVILGQGEFFGEIAALTRSPRTSSIISEGDCELLEIRWQGLRELRLRAPELKAHIDKIYRERSLKLHLLETPMFRKVSTEHLEGIAAATEFQSYGNFDWHSSYKQATATMESAQRLDLEPIIAREGDYPNGVFLIRSGFARISQKLNHGERTTSYLGKGQVFGLEEIQESWKTNKPVPFRSSLRAIGYTDVLFVPTPVLEEHVLPTLSGGEMDARGPDGPRRADDRTDLTRKLGPAMLEFLVERRFINGTAAMLIDMDRCTRCDDCVRACAATHHNNPRFLRHGPIHSHFMIANACMHCQDPVCMIGCPTGAIHREPRGEVAINDLTCIGCATCANSCPYDNIQMVTPRDPSGNLYYDGTTQLPIQKAAKCDLCNDQLPGVGPACANACPHDAMIRVDMRDFESLSKWFNR